MSSASEEEMDYDHAVERLTAMFPHITKQRIMEELEAVGSC